MYPKETLIDYVLKGQFFVVCKTYRLQDIMEQMVLWCAIHPEISETVSRLVRDLDQEFYNANINE